MVRTKEARLLFFHRWEAAAGTDEQVGGANLLTADSPWLYFLQQDSWLIASYNDTTGRR